jgi:TrbL/VirB6 plasmid conjugal transfer protein
VDQIAGWLVGQVNPLNWLRSAWAAVSGSLYDQVTGFVTSTRGPLSLEGLTASPTVVHYLTLTRLIADAALAGVLVWAFIGTMWQQSAYGHYRLRALLPRVLLASVLINFSGPLLQGAIDINRALSLTILHAGGFQLGHFFDDITHDFGVAPAPFAIVVAVGMFVSFLLLLVVYVLRYALITVLAITAPIAALLFVLHETSEHARQWSALFVTSLFMQPLQLLIIGIGWSLDSHDFGLGPLRHAFALACIVLCFRVPGVLHSSALVGRKGLSSGHSLATHAWKQAIKAHAHA